MVQSGSTYVVLGCTFTCTVQPHHLIGVGWGAISKITDGGPVLSMRRLIKVVRGWKSGEDLLQALRSAFLGSRGVVGGAGEPQGSFDPLWERAAAPEQFLYNFLGGDTCSTVYNHQTNSRPLLIRSKGIVEELNMSLSFLPLFGLISLTGSSPLLLRYVLSWSLEYISVLSTGWCPTQPTHCTGPLFIGLRRPW